MAEERAIQRNAADVKQRDYAARVEKRREERRESMYQMAMSTPAGRFALADIIVRAWPGGKVGNSPWNPHGGVQSCNIGRLEVGLELDRLLKLLAPDLWRTMWLEWDSLEQRDNRETDAVHTASATTTEGEQ